MVPPHLLAAALAALLLVAAPACSTNPVTGRREVVLVSPEREREQGREAAEVVRQEIGLVRDPALQAWVGELGQRLAAGSPRRDVEFAFAVLDAPAPNALALPGGYVYVSRGLLALTNSEDELAGVLGHEIAHVAARHHARSQTRAAGVGLLTLGPALVGALIGPPGALLTAPFRLLGGGVIAAYSREQEREADRVGQDLALAAGFDPGGLSQFLTTLERESRLRDETRHGPGFLDSHPSTPERVESARARAGALWSSAAPGSASAAALARGAYLARLDGLRVGADPGQGIFRGALFLHPDLDFALEFPEGWPSANTPASVAAASPSGDGQAALELQGEGEDALAGAGAFLEALAEEAALEHDGLETTEIHGHAAVRTLARVRARGTRFALALTWVAHDGLLYRITGAAESGTFEAHAPAFERMAGSFRRLSAPERASIEQLSIRVTRSRGSETLAELSERSGNAWSLDELALANGLEPGAVLDSGLPVKVALREPYRGPAR